MTVETLKVLLLTKTPFIVRLRVADVASGTLYVPILREHQAIARMPVSSLPGHRQADSSTPSARDRAQRPQGLVSEDIASSAQRSDSRRRR